MLCIFSQDGSERAEKNNENVGDEATLYCAARAMRETVNHYYDANYSGDRKEARRTRVETLGLGTANEEER